MDTLTTITVVANSASAADEAIDAAFHKIAQLEKEANFYSPDSDISDINRHAGKSPVQVSPDIVDLLTRARTVSETTSGAFDLTIGPVISLYDFENKREPLNGAVQKTLRLVGYRNLSVDKKQATVFLKRSGMLIDAGGIMKGYAAQKAAEVLQSHGIRAGIVAVAGDIRTFGRKPDGKPWRVGIRHPRGKGEDDIIGVLQLSDMSVSTSGDYERFFFVNGRRIHHLISPKTGHPAEGCQSVSIVSPDGALADAYSTAVFILGPEKGMKAMSENGLDGVIIDRNGTVHATPGIKDYLELKKPL